MIMGGKASKGMEGREKLSDERTIAWILLHEKALFGKMGIKGLILMAIHRTSYHRLDNPCHLQSCFQRPLFSRRF